MFFIFIEFDEILKFFKLAGFFSKKSAPADKNASIMSFESSELWPTITGLI